MVESTIAYSPYEVIEMQASQRTSGSQNIRAAIEARGPEAAVVEEPFARVDGDFEDRSAIVGQSHLPRPDRGKQAWSFLLACFLLEGIIWGFPFSFGVFQAYYSTHEPFASQKSGIAAIGTTSTGLCYFASPLAAVIYQRWPQIRRKGIILGFVLIVSSLVAASFCSDVSGLLATQGVLYSAGTLIIYFPVIVFVDEWFIARKGVAYGLMWAGAGVSGAAIPFLMQWLLDEYGFRTALRAWAACVVSLTRAMSALAKPVALTSVMQSIILTPCLFFLKPRLPVTAVNAFRPNDLTFTKHAPFWIFEMGVILQSLGFSLPQLWLPSFALSLGLPNYAGSLSVALLSVSSAIGSILMGGLADRFHVTVPVFLCTVGSTIAAFLFWGFTSSQAMLYAFSILWGTFGGGFVATWSGQAAVIGRLERTGNVNTGMVMGLLAAGKGIGSVVSGPLSSKIVTAGWGSHAIFAYGTSYGGLIVFTGISAVLGGFSCIGRAFDLV